MEQRLLLGFGDQRRSMPASNGPPYLDNAKRTPENRELSARGIQCRLFRFHPQLFQLPGEILT